MNINVFKPIFRKEEILREIEECLDKGWTGLGFKTNVFEEKWKEYTGLPNAHFLNSNTSGLHLAVKILKDVNKWSDGDEVITSPMTFVSSNHAIMYENLTPVFADVDEHLCLNPESVESLITKKTKAIMFIGIGGNVGQLKKIVELCKKHKLKLILDAAHMAGTYIKDGDSHRHVGHDADVTIFSFQSVKNLPTADSGMICFKNDDYDNLCRKMSWLGISKDTYQRTNDKGTYKWEYDLVDVGYKYHGNSVMASMGMVALKYLDVDNDKRREICDFYEQNMEKNGIKTIKSHEDNYKSSRHLFQIVVENRDRFMSMLNDKGIYPGVHYRDNTNYGPYSNWYGKCPNSLYYSDRIISLPLHMYLTEEELKYIVDSVVEINDFLNN